MGGGGGNSPRRCRGLLAETPNGVYMECAANPTPGVAGGYSRKPLTGFIWNGRQIQPPAMGAGLYFPLAKFFTSAIGRCPFPLAIYGEGVADRPGVRSNARLGGRQFPLAKFFTSAVGRCPFPLAKSMMPASAGVYTPSPFMERGWPIGRG